MLTLVVVYLRLESGAIAGSESGSSPLILSFADIAHRVTAQITKHTVNDGSRKFAELPQTRLWHQLRDHLQTLSGAVVTTFLTDGVTEAWIDFTFRGHSFTINDQFGDYWFFVDDPSCPDEILTEVVSHCERLLNT